MTIITIFIIIIIIIVTIVLVFCDLIFIIILRNLIFVTFRLVNNYLKRVKVGFIFSCSIITGHRIRKRNFNCLDTD